MGAVFGPAGTSNSYSKNISIYEYLKSFDLGAYEYQCGRGVRISSKNAEKFGLSMRDIKLSVHAPYYISLSSVEEEKRNNSVKYIVQTAKIAKCMGAARIIVHSGSCGKIDRQLALSLAKGTISKAVFALKEENLDDISICPETMGKVNQLGTLDEVLSLCEVADNMIPCVDFGHLNARTFGEVNSSTAYAEILNSIENKLGLDRLKVFHSHFSKIEYTIPGGEKKHLTFEDTEYGPDFEPLAELIARRGLSPTFICESSGTQAEDAEKMQEMYKQFL